MNYKNLIILGAGTIGKGLLRIGKRQLTTFDTITIIDVNRLDGNYLDYYRNINFQTGDAEDLDLLTFLVKPLSGRVLVVNLCSGVDSVRIRKHLGKLGTAYLDTSAGLLPDRTQDTFIDLMKYTHTRVDSPCPQWICWGMNPGLVEIVARKMLMDSHERDGNFHVTIYEHDNLNVVTKSGKLGVGWSPSDLIGEFMLTPTFEVRDDRPVQDDIKCAKPATVRWGGDTVASRIVAHEDIWNLGLIPQVSSARFAYALHPSIMEVLSSPVDRAYERLGVPEDDVPLRGKDRVAVQLISDNNERQCLVWETDHAQVWSQYGVNAVQFQVCRGIQVALDLFQRTSLGLLKGTYCPSTLPLTQREFDFIERSFAISDIEWLSCTSPDLRILDV